MHLGNKKKIMVELESQFSYLLGDTSMCYIELLYFNIFLLSSKSANRKMRINCTFDAINNKFYPSKKC